MDDLTMVIIVLSCTIPTIAAVIFYKKKKDN